MDNRIIIALVIVIVIIIGYQQHRLNTEVGRNEQFISGFWCATQEDCDIKGYTDAFLYISEIANKSEIPSYILAMQGANKQAINCPFKMQLKTPIFSNSMTGKCVAENFTLDVNIKFDMARGTMTWDSPSGEHVFTWIKNCDTSSKINV